MFLQVLFENPQFFLRYVVIIVLSICLHELAHGYAAIAQGDNTPQDSGHITMNPVVHMGLPSLLFLCFSGMAWGLMPVNPSRFRSQKYGHMLVSAAGPAMNVALALLAVLILKISLQSSLGTVISSEFMLMLARVNISLCLFNLLPIPPLDGFTVWKTFIPSLSAIEGPGSMILLVMFFVIPAFGEALFSLSDTVVMALVTA